MELRQLRYFVAVAETGGFGKAARSLHIVQAAVSQQIQRLERDLGVRLFDRTGRQIRLTHAGERLLPQAYEVLAAVERTRRVAAEVASGRPKVLRIGVGRAFDSRTREFLDRAVQRDPELTVQEIRAIRKERWTGLRGGELDAAIFRAARPVRGFERTTLWTEQLVAAFPAGHAAGTQDSGTQDVVHLEQFAGLPLRLAPRENNPSFHALVRDACEKAGFEPVPGPAFTGLWQDLYEIGRDGASWTVFYPLGELASPPGVTLRPVAGLTIDVDLISAPKSAQAVAKALLR